MQDTAEEKGPTPPKMKKTESSETATGNPNILPMVIQTPEDDEWGFDIFEQSKADADAHIQKDIETTKKKKMGIGLEGDDLSNFRALCTAFETAAKAD